MCSRGPNHAASTLPVQQLSKQAVLFHMEGPLWTLIGLDSLQSLHWASQEEFGVLMPLSGGGICVILVNSWPLTMKALPSSSSLSPTLLLVPAVHSLGWTSWTNNPQTILIFHWSIMPLVNLCGSNWRLVLSALLICAVIFELGKWLFFPCWAVLWTCVPRITKEGRFVLP